MKSGEAKEIMSDSAIMVFVDKICDLGDLVMGCGIRGTIDRPVLFFATRTDVDLNSGSFPSQIQTSQGRIIHVEYEKRPEATC